MAKFAKFLDQRGIFWGVAFLLIFIPIYPKFPLFSVPGIYVSVRLEDFLVALVVLTWMGLMVLKKEKKFLSQALTQLCLLFFAVGGLSLISAIFITKNIVPHIAFLHFLRRIEYMSLMFVAYHSLKRTKDIKILAGCLGLTTTGVFVYGLGQKFFGWPVISTMNKEFSKGLVLKLTWWARINSTFAGHYDLAAYSVLILCLSVAFLMVVKNKWAKIFTFLIILMSYYLLILTASRVSFAAYILAISFLLILLGKKWWVGPVVALSIFGMLLSADFSQRYASTFNIDLSFLSGAVKVKPSEIAIAPIPTPIPTLIPDDSTNPVMIKPGKPQPTSTPTATPTPLPPVDEPVEPTDMAVARSTDIRLKVEWPRAIRAFAKNPFLGTGYSSITLATDNDYLRILGEVGLLGTLVFAAIFLEIGRKAFLFWRQTNKKMKSKYKFERAIVLGIGAAGIGFLLNGMFIDVFEASKIAFIFWILMGVMMKTIDLVNHENLPAGRQGMKT